jgi:hypothetical protein
MKLIYNEKNFNVKELNDALANEEKLHVVFEPFVYELDVGLHIQRSNTTLEFMNGAKLFLKNEVNQAVILIGTDKEVPLEEDIIENILLLNPEADGNGKYQPSEFSTKQKWLMASVIDIRATRNLKILNGTVYHGRSAGICGSWKCENVIVDNFDTHKNFFDGIAWYDSTRINFTNFKTYYNKNAGISLDNAMKESNFVLGDVFLNGDPGIFMRESEYIRFKQLNINDNINSGVFVSFAEEKEKADESRVGLTGVNNCVWDSCDIVRNGTQAREGGFCFADANTSKNNVIVNSRIYDNPNGDIIDDSNGKGLLLSSVIRKDAEGKLYTTSLEIGKNNTTLGTDKNPNAIQIIDDTIIFNGKIINNDLQNGAKTQEEVFTTEDSTPIELQTLELDHNTMMSITIEVTALNPAAYEKNVGILHKSITYTVARGYGDLEILNSAINFEKRISTASDVNCILINNAKQLLISAVGDEGQTVRWRVYSKIIKLEIK